MLLRVADLDAPLALAGPVYDNWTTINSWSEQSRYEHGKVEADVRPFFEAITDPTNGVLPWIKALW